MKLTVNYEGEKKTISLNKDYKVSDMLKDLNINPETIMLKINSVIEPEDIILKESDKIQIIRIISGG